MPITPAQIAVASEQQRGAAHDPSERIRIVAPPGTGKSRAIEERVSWLLSNNIPAARIYVCSFTRAAALDLRRRVHAHCIQQGHALGDSVAVTTLHSLALRTLRAAGMLAFYPADPLVMDEWERENIFDAEFGDSHEVGKRRREAIRRDYEAFWSTGQWNPPNYSPPDPPVTDEEREIFRAFHNIRSQTYSCVLPGELVRQCVDSMEAGNIDPVTLLGIRHLIVDEYQDLNPVDLRFVEMVGERGAALFVAGDDDQSIYAFRFAAPSGIQQFVEGHAGAGDHVLEHCFRCTPAVLSAGQSVITLHPLPNRIPKNCTSLYGASQPPVLGTVHRWQFTSGVAEARAVAESCRRLIDAGVDPREIIVLLSYPRQQGQDLLGKLDELQIPYEYCRQEGIRSTKAGRLVLAVLRVVCSEDDYVAHRTILGLRQGVGVKTCNSVCETVIASNLSFRDCFYQDPLPDAFTGGARTALNHARSVCADIGGWEAGDTLSQRREALAAVISEMVGGDEVAVWEEYVEPLPHEILLSELRDLISSETDEQRSAVLEAVSARLEQPAPQDGLLPPRVRVMTMHGAKGLSACVVFIPGLEEDLLPGPWRAPYPGLVLEAARLLYVSLTRARATCVLSYATTRVVNGAFRPRVPSRFANSMGGPFGARTAGLSDAEVVQITAHCAEL